MAVGEISLNSLCLLSNATSGHPSHAPESVLDGKNSTFWCSTGLFPQELTLTLKEASHLSRLSWTSCRVSEFTVQVCYDDIPKVFHPVHDQDLEDSESGLQTCSIPFNSSATERPIRHVKILIHKGFAPYISLHRVNLLGTVAGAGPVADS